MIKPKKSKYVRLSQHDKDVLLRLKMDSENTSGYDNFFKYGQFIEDDSRKSPNNKHFENIP
ncbi:MAG TPA: hypothetical protein VIO64_08215 [Pseudobacteroides sp.]|uniref:hypothetical protein n=1 Tax=Pseudobacteroides sp. TaxID=1968840 RepID=UPI002F945C1A